MTSIGPSGANIVGLAIQLSTPVFVSFVQEAARGNTHPSRCTAMLNHHSSPLALDSGLNFDRRTLALVFLLLFAKALPLASSIMSLLRLTGWTHQIGKSACGGYRHDPPVRIAASEMVWTRFQLFYPEGPRRTRRSFTEQLIGCRHECSTFNLRVQNEFGAGITRLYPIWRDSKHF